LPVPVLVIVMLTLVISHRHAGRAAQPGHDGNTASGPVVIT